MNAGPNTISAFHSFIPRVARITLFVFFALIFQFSNTVYLNLTGTLTGASQMLKEDLTFFSQMTMVGLCAIYPLLFRIKLRFTSRQIITTCAVVVAAMMAIAMYSSSVVVLATASFILGAAKMVGTFETLVSIQLIITPKKDYGVFFSVALGLVLLSGQVSGIWAVQLNYNYDWRAIYRILLAAHALMIILAQVVLHNTRVAKKLPLYGIDWLGALLWSLSFTCITYIFSYGQVMDWLYSRGIRIAVFLSIIFVALTLFWMFRAGRPYIHPFIFKIKSVNTAIFIILLMQPFLSASGSVMGLFTMGALKLDDLNNAALNWYIAAGIAAGSLFSYGWFRWYNGSFKLFFVIAFLSLSLYYILLYFSLGTLADSSAIALPYFLRGFGNILLFAGTGKYITRDAGPAIFTQVLCYLAMARNALGSLIPASLLAYAQSVRTLDFHTRLAGNTGTYSPLVSDFYSAAYNRATRGGGTAAEGSIMASKGLYAKVNQQAVFLAGREIFGIMAVAGLVIILLLLLWHFSGPVTRKIPSWRAIRAVTR
jgi:MFS transporter, DHA2 family, multidrug resistance protein